MPDLSLNLLERSALGKNLRPLAGEGVSIRQSIEEILSTSPRRTQHPGCLGGRRSAAGDCRLYSGVGTGSDALPYNSRCPGILYKRSATKSAKMAAWRTDASPSPAKEAVRVYPDIDCRKDPEPVSINFINVSWDRSRARHSRLVFRPLPVPMYPARIYRVA